MRNVALVVDGPDPPRWQAHVVELVSASGELNLSEVRVVDRAPERRVWRSHRAVERRLFSFDPDPLAPSDLVQSPPSAAPDLVLWLASTAPPNDGPLIELRYGPYGERAETAYRRAAAEGHSVVGIEAILRRPAASPLVVARSFAAVRPFSIGAGLNLALWRSAVVAARAAERAPQAREPAEERQTSRARPAAAALWVNAILSWARVLGVRLLFRRPWSILVRERAADAFRGWSPRDGERVRWKSSHFYADPFLLEHEGRHHLFCEEIPAGSTRGVISHVELVRDGVAASPAPVLSAPHHLSYPFVFEHDGEVFMVPETAAARRVELYRAVKFPSEWELDCVLLDGVRAADATLFLERDCWWMWVTLGGLGTTLTDELYLYGADSLRGPWLPHPQNPIVSDVRSARPAGGIFWDGDHMIRPAQDCSRRYGWALSFQHVTALSGSDYEEHPVGRLEPGEIPGARAVHHYSRDSRFEAIDIRRRVPRFSFRRGGR